MKTQFHKTVLKNRMQLYIVPMDATDAVTLFFFCKVGSRDEKKNINGSSHFLEHLMFKGTKRRPSTLVISQELESMGAEFNAFTSKNHTAYYIKTQSKFLPKTLDILEDMLFHSIFKPQEIERERGVIIEEIKMYEENPMMHIEDLVEQAAFSGPLGWSIAGPARTIASVSRKALLDYKKKFYQPANMVCVVAGKVPRGEQKKIVQLLERLKNDHTAFPEQVPGKNVRGNILIQHKATKQSQLAIAYPAYHYNHDDVPALEVFSTLFGGSMSSRLFINVRERKGLCYYVRSEVASYEDTGVFSIVTGVASQRVPDAVQAINQEIQKAKRMPVTASELRRAKEYLKGKFILKMEASERVAQWFGQESLFMKEVKKPEERLKELDQVTTKDITRVVHDIFDGGAPSIAAVGPFTKQKIASLFRMK